MTSSALRLSDDIREIDAMSQYLTSVSSNTLLTATEEIDLAKKIEAGLYAEKILDKTLTPREKRDHKLQTTEEELQLIISAGKEAKVRFVTANLRLVVSVAKKYSRQQFPLLDIIQEGNSGLIRAVEKFDFTQGYKFSTYATWWVRQAISRGIAQQGRIVRIPTHVADQINQVLATRRKLGQLNENEVSPAAIAQELGLKEKDVMELLRFAQEHVSLDAPLDENSNTSLADLMTSNVSDSAEEVVASAQDCDQLNKMLGVLDERSADIVRRRYGLIDGRPVKLTEIAEIWGISAERVRQIERAAICKLQNHELAMAYAEN